MLVGFVAIVDALKELSVTNDADRQLLARKSVQEL